MITHPGIDPIAFSIGPIDVRWYGLMYLAGFVAFILLGTLHGRRRGDWNRDQVMDLLFYGAMGVIIGGRLGYVLFYNLEYYLQNPLEILFVQQGGMSFHGGLLGVIVGVWVYARIHDRPFLKVCDFIAPLSAPGLFFGRMANFINQELWGATTSVPWGVVFTAPGAGDLPRHPSQLYEAGLEGLLLFAVLWIYTRVDRPIGRPCGLFLIGYGLSRIFVEFFREPDAHIGYLFGGWLTTGMVLSLPMVLFGAWLFWRPQTAPAK